MADVAARLRVAREDAGLSIEDLSARTKIKPAILQAVEQGAFEEVPGGEFFTRAFIRTYARELHLPVDAVMADYDSAHPPPIVVAGPPQAPPPDLVAELRSAWGVWTATAIAVAGMIALFVMTRPAPVPESGLQPVATMGTSAPGGPATSPARSGAGTPERLTIAIRPTRRLWVTGTADDKRVLFRMLEPGEEVTLEARETMTFRLGDAGAFEYALNGVPRKPPGRDGEVREFVISRNDDR